MGNNGAIDCDESPGMCDELHFDMHIDDSDGAAEVYPLVVNVHGVEHGKKVATTYHVPFDASRGVYVIPEELMRGY
jgi:hypothetical protein